jgi:hypothetical protein
VLIRHRALFLFIGIFAAISLTPLRAQHPGNSNAYYQQLRTLLPGGEVISVANLEIHRDAGVFTFRSGSFAFFGEVNGKVTGAVFKGEGHFHLTPPTAEERHSLSILNKSQEFDEDFDEAVLRFTDSTAADLHKASTGKADSDSSYARAAEDVLSPAPGGFFFAAIKGKKNAHLFFTLDPQGANNVEPEEVSLMSWNDWGETYLSAFHAASDASRGGGKGNERNEASRITGEDLDVSIEKSGFLSGVATVHLIAEREGAAVVPLALYPTLRVSRVETDKGEALDFVQEKKDEDADFGVVLAHPLKKSETTTLKVTYGGKDVVKNEGNDNYYPIPGARESWFPNSASGLGDYATYHMLFHVPKGLQLIATGTKVSDKTDGKITTTEWKTEQPLTVVGFNLGKFVMKEAKVVSKLGDDLTIDGYANTTAPALFSNLNENDEPTSLYKSAATEGFPVGTVDPPKMLPMLLSQAEVAARIYTDYFGELPFSHIALTQQFACNYGQSWPMLVYLPICGFLDTTQQHFLGVHPEDMYWKIVTPHEVAHQWWGQTVGFRSYRDQWMSEGFADASASIFLQATRPKIDDFRDFWKQQRRLITEKNEMGFRPIDVGPVTMGFRLSTQKTGWNIYQDLIYPKGAYILHMIRMMMWTPKEGDARFKETMHDFLSTYRLQVATTEDFKAVVEKHMSPAMDMDNNHRLDWFFNEYVYGTDLPNYHFESQVTPNADGTSLHFKLTQSGVPAQFKMVVPIYLELADGKTVRLGMLAITGDSTVEKTAQLPKFPAPIKRAFINYFYDVLSTGD